MKLAAALTLAVLLAGLACSDNPAPIAGAEIIPLELEMLPLAEGTVWTYSVYLLETLSRNVAAGNRITIQRTYGHMKLSVANETPGGFTRSWQLNSVLDVDSVKVEEFLDYDLEGMTKSCNPSSYSRSYSIFYERDTLWYSDNGDLNYMMPGHFMPGGHVNLKIFNFPGTGLFLEPLPYNSRWASGDMIFLLREAGDQQSAKIGWFEGVVGVGAITREVAGIYAQDLLERELHFDLISRTTPSLASSPVRN